MSSPDLTPAVADARFKELEGSEAVIPHGDYCYSVIGFEPSVNGQPPRMNIDTCPYWAMGDEGEGYCAKLQSSDKDPDGTMLLFDQVKECGVNHRSEAEEDAWQEKYQSMRDEASRNSA